MMVTCRLYGRMANQMLQIAATVGYARRYNLPYHIPATTINPNTWPPRFTHLTNNNYDAKLPTIVLRETTHAYQEMKFDLTWSNLNIVIDGYRQSLKYFEHCLAEVRRAFPFTYSFNKNTVGLHVRIGDYKLYPDHHPVIADIYISRALSLMQRKGLTDIHVFSDSIEECTTRINQQIYPGFTFTYSDPRSTDRYDFQSLLSCEHFIISNSTFSLMAAILSESPGKIVISPSKDKWFGPSNRHLDTSDLIPTDFIQIDY